MSLETFASDLARRIPELARDSAINNANLIAQLMRERCCKRCKHWSRWKPHVTASYVENTKMWGVCDAHDGDISGPARSGNMAFCEGLDLKVSHAYLNTHGDFGCNQWKAAS